MARAAPAQVAATIASILTQRAVSFELLIVADESRDEIARVVDSFSDQRLRLIPAAVPLANPQCWNQAIAASRSPYITIVGEQDRLLGSALVELVATLERDPGAGLAHGYWFGVDQAGRIPLRAFREQRQRARRRLPEDLDHRRALVVEGDMVQALPTYRREVVAALGGFDEAYGDGAAYALALSLLDHAEIRVVPKFLCCRQLPTTAGPRRSYLRELAICRLLVRAGATPFLEADPYRWKRLALVGLLRRLRLTRFRLFVERGYWVMRRLLRRVSPLRLLRGELGSGRLYQLLVDRMSWWPLGRARPAASGGAAARIAYVLWRYPQLSETFIRREVHALRAAGVAVDVIADEAGEGIAEDHPAAPGGAVRYLNPVDPARARRLTRAFLLAHPLRVTNLLLYSVFHRYAREKTLRRDVRMLRKAIYLAGVLRERKATHVHAPWADQHAFLALLASRLLGLPYSVQARAHEIHRSTATFALAEKLRNARFVVTNSVFNAAHLRPLLGDRAAGLHTIYNGIDLTQFQPPVRGGEAQGSPRLLAVGRLVEQKGFDDLLRACALLRDRGLAFRCDIIGGPREPEDTNSYVELGKLHRRLGLGGQVCFLGELPFSRVLDAYRMADIFVLPCVVAADGGSDVTPNALIEAMAMRLPVVSSHIAAIPEIVEDGTSGVLVPPRNPAVLADALARLLADAELRARLGTAARKRIEQRFDIERNIRRYVALFHG